MGFSRQGAGLYRVLASPAVRLTASVAALVLAVGLFAGAVRVLPLFLGPALPLRLGLPLARGVLAVSLETALFVAPPLAWALACSALVERGEARALFAIGARPYRIVASAWPAALVVAAASGLASGAWGREAAAPGRLARELVAEARAACVASYTSGVGPGAARAIDVPSLGFSWVCFPGDEPRIVGPAPLHSDASAQTPGGEANPRGEVTGTAVLSASAIHLSDDLRAIRLEDVTISTRAPGSLASERLQVRLHVKDVAIQGIAPLGRASNLDVVTRALLLALSSIAMASLAAFTVLALSVRERARALAIGVAGPAASLMVFSSLERSSTAPLAYSAVPLAGLSAVAAILGVARALRRGGRVMRA
jgi:hypothetical protein